MNLVLDDAEEVHLKTKKRRPLGMFIHEIRYYRKLTVNCQTDSDVLGEQEGTLLHEILVTL